MQECFSGYTDAIHDGWVLDTVPTTVHFNGDEVELGEFGLSTFGRVHRPYTGVVTPVSTTIQWRFRQVASVPPNGSISYQVAIDNAFSITLYFIALVGNGNLIVLVGGSQYAGAWTPGAAGSSHTVHFTADGAGLPSLWIDGVLTPLVLQPPSFVIAYPAPSIGMLTILNANIPFPGKGAFDWFFITSGVLPPTTVFCCPDGSSAH